MGLIQEPLLIQRVIYFYLLPSSSEINFAPPLAPSALKYFLQPTKMIGAFFK